jgi:hypothetical protein
MLKRVVWTENTVLGVQLRQDLFTLAQMRRNHIMQFFDIQRTNNDWGTVDLNKFRSLFFIFVAENRLKPLFNEVFNTDKVIPSSEAIPKLMLSAVIGNDGVHCANLIELNQDYSTDGKRIVKQNLTSEIDIDVIYHHELAGMIGDPEKIRKRLIRFFDTGVNFDDSKVFLFKDIELPQPQSQRSSAIN